ncbi:prefoldin subunit 1 [Ostrinia nubilalis]|uniref:prefoldin subunit 1 n=1 Tax=Ostrinia furnacalis TaxID=93504 RepID=UPI00103B9EED|nr:prefoldin subunit 1 [Ostrinia furnacalis]
MAKPADAELQKALVKMVETSKKTKLIDSQIAVLKRVVTHLDLTKGEINALPAGTKTYESIGRMFLLTDLEEVKTNLKNREAQLLSRRAELEKSKQYLEKNLKESQDNIREMVQQRKELEQGEKPN